jgi:uncharacterized protein YdaU (DUF1376 family)
MHKYLHHIGDFTRDTVHLTALEECFYRRALDFYYLNEAPLPKETQSVFRRLRANTEEEKQAVLNVLADFFTDEEDGFHNKRCDAEILGYKVNAQKNRENGKKGGRPPKKSSNENPSGGNDGDSNNPEKTHSVNLGSENETQKNLNHKPLTDNQFIDSSSNTREAENSGVPPIQFATYKQEDHKRYTLLECANQYPIHEDFIALASNRYTDVNSQDLQTMFVSFGDWFTATDATNPNTPSVWLVKWYSWIQNNKDQVKRNREKQTQLTKQQNQSEQPGYFMNMVSEQQRSNVIDVTPEVPALGGFRS